MKICQEAWDGVDKVLYLVLRMIGPVFKILRVYHSWLVLIGILHYLQVVSLNA